MDATTQGYWADKALVALIVVLASWLVNYLLEIHRANQAIRAEFAKRKVADLSRVWTAFADLEVAMLEVNQAIKWANPESGKPIEGHRYDLKDANQNAFKQAGAFRQALVHAQVWLEVGLAERISNHGLALLEFYFEESSTEPDAKKLEDTRSERQTAMAELRKLFRSWV